MAVTVRLRDEEEEMIKEAALEMMFETKIRIKESDLIHAYSLISMLNFMLNRLP